MTTKTISYIWKKSNSFTWFRGYQFPWNLCHPTPTLLCLLSTTLLVLLSESPQNCVKAKPIETLTLAFLSKELSWSLWKVSVSFGSKVMVNCYFFFSFFSLQGSLEKLFSFCFSMQALIFSHVTLGNIIFEKKNILRKMCGAWVPSHGGTQSSSIHLDFLFFCA